MPQQTQAPTFAVAGETSASLDSNPGPSAPEGPSPLLYAAAAVLGLVVVLGGGWLYVNRPWTR
jgi:hypothetical protein